MAADADRDGFITPAEFAVYYQGLGTCKARQQLRSSMGLEAESAPDCPCLHRNRKAQDNVLGKRLGRAFVACQHWDTQKDLPVVLHI